MELRTYGLADWDGIWCRLERSSTGRAGPHDDCAKNRHCKRLDQTFGASSLPLAGGFAMVGAPMEANAGVSKL